LKQSLESVVFGIVTYRKPSYVLYYFPSRAKFVHFEKIQAIAGDVLHELIIAHSCVKWENSVQFSLNLTTFVIQGKRGFFSNSKTHAYLILVLIYGKYVTKECLLAEYLKMERVNFCNIKQ
jgi:hypothetical protein